MVKKKLMAVLVVFATLVLTSIGASPALASPLPTAPSPVTNLLATPSPTSVVVYFTASFLDGGSPILSYKITGIDLDDSAGSFSDSIDHPLFSGTLFTNLLPNDRYDLTVVAVNDVGESTPTTISFTTPAMQASAPTNLHVSRFFENDQTWTLYVSMNSPVSDGGLPISQYIVSILNTDDNSTVISLGEPDGNGGLVAAFGNPTFGNYLISAYVVTSFGDGASTATIPYSVGIVAPDPITGLNVTYDSDHSITGSWTAPANNGGESVVYDVVLTDTSTNTDAGRLYNLTTTSVNMQVSILSSDSYTLTVTAKNNSGGSAASVTSSSVTAIGITPPQATHVDTVASSNHSPYIVASWFGANDNGSPVTGYTVILEDSAGNTLRTVPLSALKRSYVFTNLDNETTYRVVITSTNLAGTSPDSNVSTVTTKPFVPEALPSTVVENSLMTGIEVTVVDGIATVHVDGAHSGDWVFGYAYSVANPLGWTQVNASGDAIWNLPSGLAFGTHHIVVVNENGALFGVNTFKLVAPAVDTPPGSNSANNASNIAANNPKTLASTGADASGLILMALLLLMLGTAAMRASRYRKVGSNDTL